MDITDVILTQHHDQRRTFALLDEIPAEDTASLAAVWKRLVVLLEVHAEAEEKFFYPALLKRGQGAEGDEGPGEEVEDAVKDHNEIRDAVRAVDRHQVGSDAWWAAVREARQANSEHMAEEERDDLADFRRTVGLQTRHDIAIQFLTYASQHAEGIPSRDKDPEDYLEAHR